MKFSFITHSVIVILLIATSAITAGWGFFDLNSQLLGMMASLSFLLLIWHLISYQARLFRKINYFFDAVRNEDSALSFPKNNNDKFLNQLSSNLDRINEQLKRIKTESHQREQYFQTLTEHVATGIISFDETGFILNANKSLKRMLGLEQLTHLRQLKKVDGQLANMLLNLPPGNQRMLTIKTAVGRTVNLLIKSTSFKNENRTLRLVSLQDINDQLSEQELDSWLKLIRVLTHEIMNSIAPVTSLSENLRNLYTREGKVITPEMVSETVIAKTAKGLEVIEQQGKGLIRFVESYRKLTRLPKPEIKPVNLKNLIENTVLLNKSSWPDLRISLQILDADLRIPADEKLFSQVLINLLKNSAEALEGNDNGKISITVLLNPDNRVEITIKDNGPGIPPGIMEEIFVPFFTTRENGSGIGLSLSRQIIRLHGGKLNARSQPGKETVFCIEVDSAD
ncbi:ATP-binding protein [Marinilabilia sp.]|uniref:sensor histidine kinase n=1 Tax=Marinilabilia sp. TaxID=2021252 RepID=UPI0025BE95F8|nr:ATP-binding protein [Marinilabilia sp.]